MEIVINASEWRKFEARLQRMIRGSDDVAEKIVKEDSEFLLEQIRSNIQSQGLVETGEYLDSWFIVRHGRLEFAAVSRHPAAHRLEYGFVGQDALGRHYAQAPRPHVLPAKQATMTKFTADLREGVGKLWRRS